LCCSARDERGKEYQADPKMDPFIRQEPVHPRPLIRKGMGISPRGLGFLLRLGDRWTRVVAWDAAGIEAGGMRRRAKFIRLVEHDGFSWGRGRARAGRGRTGEMSGLVS
jgi:hypothetical protein